MKKILLLLGTLIIVFSLSACASGSADQSEESSEAAVSENSSTEETKSIFMATLVEDAKANEDAGKTFRLVLTDVKVVQDPEGIEKQFKNDGVILNITDRQLHAGQTMADFASGKTVTVTLKGLPIMTMSIPPQIPGNSIDDVKVEK